MERRPAGELPALQKGGIVVLRPSSSGIYVLLLRLMLTVTILLCSAAFFVGVSQDRKHFSDFLVGILMGVILFCFLLPAVANLLLRLRGNGALFFLIILCFTVKLFWVATVRVPVSGDYAVFWGYANALSQQAVLSGGRYMALFPHIFGYSQVLSLFLALFGSYLWLPPLLNVLLSVCSGYFLFRLCLQWLSLRAAVYRFLLWIICPSQTIYNSLVLSEPLYTALILGFLLVVTNAFDGRVRTRPVLSAAASGLLGGILLRLIQGCRPIAAILILAFLLWFFLIRPAAPAKRAVFSFGMIVSAVLILVYLCSGVLWNALITYRIQEEPSSTPGYSILVGFNEESGGRWNQEDSDKLYEYNSQANSTAQQVQEQMLSDAIARITDGGIDFPQLFVQKFRYFLGSDDSCVGYSNAVLRHTPLFSTLCNGFFYLILMTAVFGAVKLWRSKTATAYTLVPLYITGLILAQMLVEVAGRYHYSIIPMLILLGQAALHRAKPIPGGSQKDRGCSSPP